MPPAAASPASDGCGVLGSSPSALTIHQTKLKASSRFQFEDALARFLRLRASKHGGVHRWHNEVLFLDAQDPV